MTGGVHGRLALGCNNRVRAVMAWKWHRAPVRPPPVGSKRSFAGKQASPTRQPSVSFLSPTSLRAARISPTNLKCKRHDDGHRWHHGRAASIPPQAASASQPDGRSTRGHVWGMKGELGTASQTRPPLWWHWHTRGKWSANERDGHTGVTKHRLGGCSSGAPPRSSAARVAQPRTPREDLGAASRCETC